MTFAEAPSAIVVDASVAIPFLQGDRDWGLRWASWAARGSMVLVPPHFPVEVANGLLRGTSIRSTPHVLALIGKLYGAGFDVADRGEQGLAGSIQLAELHRLTVYDAAYLDLAIDVDGELATLDQALRRAADAEGIPLAA